jgi:SSS family solute:Na+ symporter
VTGTLVTVFFYIFIHKAESSVLGISKLLLGRDVLITQMPWPVVDPIVVALPLAFLVTVAVSLFTKEMDKKYVDKCFEGIR